MVRSMRMLLDSRSVLELFSGSVRGSKVKALVERADEVLLSAVTLFEVGAAIERAHGAERAEEYIRSMRSHWRIVDVDAEIATEAVRFRRMFKAPMTDCILISTAKRYGSRLAAGCSHLKKLSKELDIIIV